MSNLFRVFNFCGSGQPRKYFDNENFWIYGIGTTPSAALVDAFGLVGDAKRAAFTLFQ